MNMKKMLSLALAGVMALSLMACSAQNGGDSSENTSSPGSSQSSEETQNNETPESVTITSLNANKEAAELEVPYDPQRIAILDMASLDILDALGVGDRVVGTADTSLEYLQDYINDDIANLGTIKEADLEAVMACLYRWPSGLQLRRPQRDCSCGLPGHGYRAWRSGKRAAERYHHCLHVWSGGQGG